MNEQQKEAMSDALEQFAAKHLTGRSTLVYTLWEAAWEACLNSAPVERQALQAEGKHPAPCARHCEATAFKIEIQTLQHGIRQKDRRIAELGAKLADAEAVERQAPDGFAIVPLEPTDEMLDAGCDASDAYRVDIARSWDAMIAAAPSAQGRTE